MLNEAAILGFLLFTLCPTRPLTRQPEKWVHCPRKYYVPLRQGRYSTSGSLFLTSISPARRRQGLDNSLVHHSTKPRAAMPEQLPLYTATLPLLFHRRQPPRAVSPHR